MTTVRQATFSALKAVEMRGAFVDIVLSQLGKQAKLSTRDRALLNELVRGTVRWQKRLDWIIDKLYSGKPRSLPLAVRLALRMALYQIIFLEHIPDFAAINESVELVKRTVGHRWGGVTNGILREFLRSQENIDYPDERSEPIKSLAVKYSHPEWMVSRWLDRYGLEFTKGLCQANNRVPTVSIRINRLRAKSKNIEKILSVRSSKFTQSEYLTNFYRVKGFENIERQKEFQQGLFTVQDVSAGLVGKLLCPPVGSYVIDLCAAPGGKTTHAAEMIQDNGLVVANDRNITRLGLIHAAVKRLRLHSIKMVNSNGAFLAVKPAQLVLVDAPCSGFGVLAKKPDLRWRRKENDIRELLQVQQALLENAANLLSIDGILVYSTCTYEPAENEKMVERFMRQYKNFVLENASEFVPAKLVDSNGYIQTFPHLHNMDGSFAARLRKIG